MSTDAKTGSTNGTTTNEERFPDRPADPPLRPADGPAAHQPKSPPPHLHDAPPPPPEHDHDHDGPHAGSGGSMAKPAALVALGVLAGVAGGFAVGRATAPRGRFALRLPFGARFAPVVVRGTYKTGKAAGKGSVRASRALGFTRSDRAAKGTARAAELSAQARKDAVKVAKERRKDAVKAAKQGRKELMKLERRVEKRVR